MWTGRWGEGGDEGEGVKIRRRKRSRGGKKKERSFHSASPKGPKRDQNGQPKTF